MGTAEALALETLQHRREQDKDHRWLVLNTGGSTYECESFQKSLRNLEVRK